MQRCHIRKVDPFAIHITINGSFGGCNSQALRKDAAEVRGSRAVPKSSRVLVGERSPGGPRCAGKGNCEDGHAQALVALYGSKFTRFKALLFERATDAEDVDDFVPSRCRVSAV